MDTKTGHFASNIADKPVPEVMELYENIISAARILVEETYFEKYIVLLMIELVSNGGIQHIVSKYEDEFSAGIARTTPIDIFVLSTLQSWGY